MGTVKKANVYQTVQWLKCQSNQHALSRYVHNRSLFVIFNREWPKLSIRQLPGPSNYIFDQFSEGQSISLPHALWGWTKARDSVHIYINYWSEPAGSGSSELSVGPFWSLKFSYLGLDQKFISFSSLWRGKFLILLQLTTKASFTLEAKRRPIDVREIC